MTGTPSMQGSTFNAQVEEVLRGSYDLHVHAGPDPYQERRLDALETARWAQEAEMGGFVLKAHASPTAALAQAIDRVYPSLNVAGALVLNREVGGLNPDAVEAAALLGARVVWMPTYSADYFFPRLRRHTLLPAAYVDKVTATPGIRLTDERGELLPQVFDILDLIKEHDMVLASGHVSPADALAVFKAAVARGIERMIATHPHAVATEEEQREMASLGAYVEQTFLSCMPYGGRTPAEMVAEIRELGVERCFVTTDFGQPANPPPAEGMRMAIATLMEEGLTAGEVSLLVKENPGQLARG